VAVKKNEPIAIRLDGVSFSYPILGAKVSGRGAMTSALGGLMRNNHGRVTIDALDHLDLTVRRGQRLGILGHNGAGKSTLLRVMAGIFPPSTGTVEIHGRIATLFDKMLGMDAELTGADNIRVRGMFLGWSDAEIEARREEIVEFCELGDYLQLPVRTYSPGMRSRLGFAISTSFPAEILLLDEWMGAGDKRFAEQAKKRMDEFYENAGAVVLASHNVSLIERNCDSIIVLEKGRVIERGDL